MIMVSSYTIIVASVGGQGGLTLSRVIANAAFKLGFHVRVGVTLGMSQRFGSVHSYIRFGKNVYSPLPMDSADVILGLEPLEAVRTFNYVNSASLTPVNVEAIPTQTTIIGLERYPKIDKLIDMLKLRSKVVKTVEASKDSIEMFDNAMQANMIMLGVFASTRYNPIPKKLYEEAIVEVLGEKKGVNARKAFNYGFNTYRDLY